MRYGSHGLGLARPWSAWGRLASLLLMAGSAAEAHHSMERFDVEALARVEGKVVRVEWVNPHVYIYLQQLTESGDVLEWEIEGFPPAAMRRLGWSRSTLAPGDVLAVSGNPARNPEHRSLYPTTIERGDRALLRAEEVIARMASAGPESEERADGLAGTWVTLVSMPVMMKFINPRGMPPTTAGIAAIDGYDEATMLPGKDCIPTPAPAFMFNPDVKRITMQEETITIAGDFDGGERTIHLGATSHAGERRSIHGHSTGRWEGDALVIETAHFADHRNGHGWGLPSGAQKQMVERLTVSGDGKSLTYAFEVRDPEFLAEPFAGEVVWAYRPDVAFTPEPCDLENARRFADG